MARHWYFGLLQVVATLMLAHAATPIKRNELPTDPSEFIRKLYSEVTWFHPLGILDNEYVGQQKPKLVGGNAARKRFIPYLSPSLRRRVAAYDACLADWSRQHTGEVLKAPAFEGGMFSGSDERSEPERFKLEKIESMKDNSLRAFLTLSAPIVRPNWTTWHVEVLLVRGEQGLGVEDVIYTGNEEESIRGGHLSEILLSSCSRMRLKH